MIKIKSLILLPAPQLELEVIGKIEEKEAVKLVSNELYAELNPVTKKGKRHRGLTRRFCISTKKGLQDPYYPAVDEFGNVFKEKSPRVYRVIDENPMKVYHDVYTLGKIELNRNALKYLKEKLIEKGYKDFVNSIAKKCEEHGKKTVQAIERKKKWEMKQKTKQNKKKNSGPKK